MAPRLPASRGATPSGRTLIAVMFVFFFPGFSLFDHHDLARLRESAYEFGSSQSSCEVFWLAQVPSALPRFSSIQGVQCSNEWATGRPSAGHDLSVFESNAPHACQPAARALPRLELSAGRPASFRFLDPLRLGGLLDLVHQFLRQFLSPGFRLGFRFLQPAAAQTFICAEGKSATCVVTNFHSLTFAPRDRRGDPFFVVDWKPLRFEWLASNGTVLQTANPATQFLACFETLPDVFRTPDFQQQTLTCNGRIGTGLTEGFAWKMDLLASEAGFNEVIGGDEPTRYIPPGAIRVAVEVQTPSWLVAASSHLRVLMVYKWDVPNNIYEYLRLGIDSFQVEDWVIRKQYNRMNITVDAVMRLETNSTYRSKHCFNPEFCHGVTYHDMNYTTELLDDVRLKVHGFGVSAPKQLTAVATLGDIDELVRMEFMIQLGDGQLLTGWTNNAIFLATTFVYSLMGCCLYARFKYKRDPKYKGYQDREYYASRYEADRMEDVDAATSEVAAAIARGQEAAIQAWEAKKLLDPPKRRNRPRILPPEKPKKHPTPPPGVGAGAGAGAGVGARAVRDDDSDDGVLMEGNDEFLASQLLDDSPRPMTGRSSKASVASGFDQ